MSKGKTKAAAAEKPDEKPGPAPTAAEIAAQVLLLDSAVIHVFEKTLAAARSFLDASRELHESLVKALVDGDELAGLWAENERLSAEITRLQAALDETGGRVRPATGISGADAGV